MASLQAEIQFFIDKWLMDYVAASADALSLIVDDSFSIGSIEFIREKSSRALNILANGKDLSATIESMREQHGNPQR